MVFGLFAELDELPADNSLSLELAGAFESDSLELPRRGFLPRALVAFGFFEPLPRFLDNFFSAWLWTLRVSFRMLEFSSTTLFRRFLDPFLEVGVDSSLEESVRAIEDFLEVFPFLTRLVFFFPRFPVDVSAPLSMDAMDAADTADGLRSTVTGALFSTSGMIAGGMGCGRAVTGGATGVGGGDGGLVIRGDVLMGCRWP